MSSITNIYLHYATNLDSYYKTIDDYILEKHQKKIRKIGEKEPQTGRS